MRVLVLTGPIIQELDIPGHSQLGLLFSVNSSESTQLRLLRPLLLLAAGASGADTQLEQATQVLLNASASSGSAVSTSVQEGWVSLIPADLRAAVYTLSVMSGNISAHKVIKSLYLQVCLQPSLSSAVFTAICLNFEGCKQRI
jgi:hypothetical protein